MRSMTNSGSHPNQLCAIVWEYFLNRDGVSENSNSETLTTHNTQKSNKSGLGNIQMFRNYVRNVKGVLKRLLIIQISTSFKK